MGVAGAKMKPIDAVDPSRAANLYFRISHRDVDVAGAAMDRPDAGGAGGVDIDGGVLHGNVQVSRDVLDPDDASRRRVIQINDQRRGQRRRGRR